MSKYHIYQWHSCHNACHLHRMLLPSRHCSEELKQDDIEITVNSLLPANDDFTHFMWHGTPSHFDQLMLKAVKWLYQDKKLIWMIDDDIGNLPKWNPVKLDEEQAMGAIWALTDNRIHINCSTFPLLKTLEGRPNTSVTPNLLEPYQYDKAKKALYSANIRFMWSGSQTHQGDMAQIVEPVTYIRKNYEDVEFLFFGDCHSEIRKRCAYNGLIQADMVPLGDYYRAMQSFAPDIWLSPLAEHPFNCSKSNLKAIEGMALKIPIIASDVTPYSETVIHGENGLIARNEDEWTDYMQMLIKDESSRKRLGANGRRFVEENFNWYNAKCREPWLTFYRSICNVE